MRQSGNSSTMRIRQQIVDFPSGKKIEIIGGCNLEECRGFGGISKAVLDKIDSTATVDIRHLILTQKLAGVGSAQLSIIRWSDPALPCLIIYDEKVRDRIMLSYTSDSPGTYFYNLVQMLKEKFAHYLYQIYIGPDKNNEYHGYVSGKKYKGIDNPGMLFASKVTDAWYEDLVKLVKMFPSPLAGQLARFRSKSSISASIITSDMPTEAIKVFEAGSSLFPVTPPCKRKASYDEEDRQSSVASHSTIISLKAVKGDEVTECASKGSTKEYISDDDSERSSLRIATSDDEEGVQNSGNSDWEYAEQNSFEGSAGVRAFKC